MSTSDEVDGACPHCGQGPRCADCDEALDAEEIRCGNDQCFSCYVAERDHDPLPAPTIEMRLRALAEATLIVAKSRSELMIEAADEIARLQQGNRVSVLTVVK